MFVQLNCMLTFKFSAPTHSIGLYFLRLVGIFNLNDGLRMFTISVCLFATLINLR